MVRRKSELFVKNGPSANGEGNLIMHAALRKTEKEDLFGGSGRLFGHCVLNKNCSIGRHYHHGEFEAYYILSGAGVYDDNGSQIILHPGDMTYCGSGEFHAIENREDEPLVFMCLINRLERVGDHGKSDR